MRNLATVALVFAALLTAAPGAEAKPKHHQKTKHCKHGHVLKTRKVKRHRHGKTVHVRIWRP